MPTLMAQLRRDFLIHGEKDGQEIFDSLAAQTKELLWISRQPRAIDALNRIGVP